MKRHLSSATLVATLVTTLLTAHIAYAAPELAVQQGTFDFGTIPQGKKVQHSFKIRNSGDEPLNIEKLEAACGCTAVKPSSSVIKPGQSARIDVVFDSATFGGKVVKTVTMTTNAGRTPTYTFSMTGNITEEVQVIPRQLSLGLLTPGVAKLVTVKVVNHGEDTLKILGANVTSSALQIRPTIKGGEIKAGGTGRIELSILAKPEAKILSGYLHIVTSSTQKKEITVPMYGSVAK